MRNLKKEIAKNVFITSARLNFSFADIQRFNFGAQARPPKGVERAPKYWNCADPKTTFFALKSQPKHQIQRAYA
jgi:hypothetical protein